MSGSDFANDTQLHIFIVLDDIRIYFNNKYSFFVKLFADNINHSVGILKGSTQ